MSPLEIWAGNNTVTYTSLTGTKSVTFQDGHWSAQEQPGWTKYIRADFTSEAKIDNEDLHFVQSHPEAVARQMTKYRERIDELQEEIEKLHRVIGRLKGCEA